jgi:hypothetical protein
MAALAHLTLFALLFGGTAAVAQELDPDQSALLEKAREAAFRYSASLPDFICTELVRRSEDPRGLGRWRQIDKLTIRLSYSGHKEDYKLMLIDGKPTVLDFFYAGGAISTGEFGTRLQAVFDPRSHGDFRWKGWTTLRKRRVARFSYHIARENSIFKIQYGTSPVGPNAIVVPYRGEVFVDEETHMALRLTQQAEIPQNFPITANDSTVDYDFAKVGGKQYLLPSHADIRTKSGSYIAENNVEFTEYRKFETETNITFEPPPDKQ